MLDITLPELMGSAQEYMFAYEAGVCMYECHYVLQLVPETKCAS